MHILKTLILLLLASASPGLAVEQPGGSYAEGLVAKKLVLAVGIDHFTDPIWRALKYPRRDAASVYNFFLGKDAGFDGGELLADERGTTASQIMAALERLKVDNRNEDDTVVIYLSMHGTVAYKANGQIGRYIITSDTDSQHVAATSVDYDKLMEAFQHLRSRKKVLILAFCHSGVGKSALTPDMKRALAQIKAPYFDEPIQERSEGSIVLTASGWQEPALEDDTLAGDVYTHFLLEGFTKDTKGDGVVSITEAHEYAAQRTYQYTSGRQRPSAIVELLGADPILVKGGDRSKRKGAMLYSLMRRFSNLQVFADGKPKGSLEKGVSLPEGRVRLRLEDPATKMVVAERVVTFRDGKEYSVADLLVPHLANTLVVGEAVQGFQGAGMRAQYAPRQVAGTRLRYLREEAVQIFDLGVDAAYFPLASEEVDLAAGRRVSQSRRQAMLTTTLGLREKVGLLSTQHAGLLTEARLGAGPSVLFIERRLDQPGLDQPYGRYLSPGLAAQVGLDWTFPYYLLKVGIDGNLGIYRNFTAMPGNIAESRLVGLSVGTFW